MLIRKGKAEVVSKLLDISYSFLHGMAYHMYVFHSSTFFDRLIHKYDQLKRENFLLYNILNYRYEFHNFFSFCRRFHR